VRLPSNLAGLVRVSAVIVVDDQGRQYLSIVFATLGQLGQKNPGRCIQAAMHKAQLEKSQVQFTGNADKFSQPGRVVYKTDSPGWFDPKECILSNSINGGCPYLFFFLPNIIYNL